MYAYALLYVGLLLLFSLITAKITPAIAAIIIRSCIDVNYITI